MTTKHKSYSEELTKKYGRISFGTFLLSWRKSEGLSQVEFAKKCGLSAANLCDLEQGRRVPSAVRAKQIAKKLRLPEKGLITLAVQDMLQKQGLNYGIELTEAA